MPPANVSVTDLRLTRVPTASTCFTNRVCASLSNTRVPLDSVNDKCMFVDTCHHTQTQTTHTHTQAPSRAHARTHTHAITHARTHAHTHTHTHTHTGAITHARTHTYTQAPSRTHARTHTHTQFNIPIIFNGFQQNGKGINCGYTN